MEDINDIGKVMTVLQGLFPLKRWKEKMADSRRRPQIPPVTIAQLVLEMVVRNQKSLLAVDQAARYPETLYYYGSKRRMVASDTTIQRSLAGFEVEGLHEALWDFGSRILKLPQMKATLPSGRKAIVASVDGSVWGKDEGSVLMVSGAEMEVVVGYQMSAGRGHELASTRALLEWAGRVYGHGWADYIVADALYMAEADWRLGLGLGHHLVVKTKEEDTLAVIEDAKGLFFGPEGPAEGVEVRRGYDRKRNEEYEIIGCGGFQWHGLSLKVAYVREKPVKPRKDGREAEPFWVITTDETLSLEDMRFIAHARWGVENKGFRRLSQLVGSKRRLTNNATVREALTGLWLLGLGLFLYYQWRCGRLLRRGRYGKAKRTTRWLGERYEGLIARAYYLRQAG
jgi:hypothetical protein